jgi:hypothetical protein
MSSGELLPHELMQIVADFFESQQVPYRIVGSMASMAYGEPRFTNDIDIVAELTAQHAAAMCQAFSMPNFYLAELAVREAIARRSQFNIVHPASGLKVDVIVPPDDEFARSEATRVRRITNPGQYSAWFCSPEDAILKKIVYYKLSGGVSDKHLRDIAGVMKLQGHQLDQSYLRKWSAKLGVLAEWESIRRQLPAP